MGGSWFTGQPTTPEQAARLGRIAARPVLFPQRALARATNAAVQLRRRENLGDLGNDESTGTDVAEPRSAARRADAFGAIQPVRPAGRSDQRAGGRARARDGRRAPRAEPPAPPEGSAG